MKTARVVAAIIEHEDARWLDAAHIDSVDWLPADVKVVEALKEQQEI